MCIRDRSLAARFQRKVCDYGAYRDASLSFPHKRAMACLLYTSCSYMRQEILVAPHAGAWIETNRHSHDGQDYGRRTPCAVSYTHLIADNKALIGREATRRYGGMYGPTCVVDFALSVGSVPNLVNKILIGLDIPEKHKKTILACKSWGMNTSYGFGAAFRAAIESGKSAAEAEEAEIEQFQFIYKEPVEAQARLMETHNLGGHGPHSSFDVRKYMAQYKERMRPYVVAALKAGVHPANITAVPAYCVGDVGHHISQSAYNMFKSDMVFGIYDAVMQVFENTLRKGLKDGAFKSEWDVLTVATGAPACAVAYILWLEDVYKRQLTTLPS